MSKKRKLNPLGERVVLKEVGAEESTGIVLPEDVDSGDEIREMEVVATGTEMNGIKLKKGDVVIIKKESGTPLELGDTRYRIVDLEDLLATIE